MIKWRTADDAPNNGRMVVGVWQNPIGSDDVETVCYDNGEGCWYDKHENLTDTPDYWCELSDLNLPEVSE